MKRFITILSLILPVVGFSQVCSVNKCINESATAQVTTPQAGYNYNWTISPSLTFTGQGSSIITIPSVGNTTQVYTVSCVVTSASGCDTAITCNINVVTNTAQLNLPSICSDNGLVDLRQYANPQGGTFSGTGVVGNTFNPAVGTSTITYTVVGGNGCSGSATATIAVEPAPNPGVIQIN